MDSLTTIAADIRKHSPGVLPESVVITSDDRLVLRHSPCRMDDGRLTHSLSAIPDDIAEAVLRDAMIHDPSIPDIVRNNTPTAANGLGYTTYGPPNGDPQEAEEFLDDDHGGSLGACYQAWRYAHGITD